MTKENKLDDMDGLFARIAAEPVHAGLSQIDALALASIARRRARAAHFRSATGACLLAMGVGIGGAMSSTEPAPAVEIGLSGPPPLAPSSLLAPDA